MGSSAAPPVVSVVITCDYGSGKPEAWEGLRAVLRALARQDFSEPVEFLLVESASMADQVPADLRTILPGLRLIANPATASPMLKNAGIAAASAELIAIFDGDCVPDAGWLRHFVDFMREHPEAVAVSGRTRYGTEKFLDRAMALATRAYLDEGAPAETRHLADNNAGLRRAFFLAHPFSESAGPHMSLLQSEPIVRAGGRLFFNPLLCVQHHYNGWTNEKHIRRSMGYGVIRVRRIDPGLPYAWMAHLGYLSVPLFIGARTLASWRNCLRCARWYGVAWYQLPLAFALSAAACAMEAPGMVRALRGQPLDRTAYR